MIEAGCYTMHIRCDTGHRMDGDLKEYNLAQAWEYTGRTEADCKRQAKAAGWTFKKDGKTYCPYCSGTRTRRSWTCTTSRQMPRYSLSYMTPNGTRVRLFNLLESAVREIQTVQKTLGSSDFRIEEQERPEDQFSMGDPHPCDMTAEERERAFAPSNAKPVHCGPIILIQLASGTVEEAARRLEAYAAAIEEAKRATMKPGEVFYDPEVSTLKAAAAMLRRSDSRRNDA